jgi:hypothetical protein
MIAFVLVAALGCADSLSRAVEPNAGPSQDSTRVPSPVTRTGAATVTISVGGSGQVSVAQGAQRGTVVPVVIGTPTFDGATRTVSLSVGLHNADRLRMHAPASVRAAVPSLSGVTVSTPAIASPAGSVQAPVPAAPLGAGASDTSTTSLASGATSEGIVVRLTMPSGVSTVTVTLQGTGTVVYGIALRAPHSVPDSIARQARAAAVVPTATKHHIAYNLMFLGFEKTASLDDRQTALEAINGTVVGGSALGAPNNYLMRVPVASDPGAGPLLHAMDVVRQMPHVRYAIFDDLDPLTDQFQRPKDGTGFPSWQLTRSAATASTGDD